MFTSYLLSLSNYPHRYRKWSIITNSYTFFFSRSGQETITYLLQGSVDHEDFAGNKGTIHKGDLQFMTAGRGIIHAEMPGKSIDGSPNVGLQLWVDLPKHLKFCEPRYRDLRAEEIPTAKADSGKVEIKIISGTSYGVDSVRDLAYTPVWILDVTMKAGGKLSQALPRGWNAFVYTLSGNAIFLGKRVEEFHSVVFGVEGDGLEVEVEEGEKRDARFSMFYPYSDPWCFIPGHFLLTASGILVIIAGQPLDQTVIQYGPFVLNTNEQVYEALLDYQSNSNGFERAKGWKSEIGRRKR